MPPIRDGFGVKVRFSFRIGGQPDNCPLGKLSPVRVRGWVRVSFGVRRAIFLGGNCPRTV